MKKQEIIDFLSDLGLPEEVFEFLSSYIKEHDLSDEVRDRVASVLELMAEESTVKAEILEREAAVYTNLAAEILGAEKFERAKMLKLFEEFVSDLEDNLSTAEGPTKNAAPHQP